MLSDYTAAAPLGDSAPLASALGYSPPEAVQASVAARSHTVVSAAADVWSLGVVAFEVLTGRPALQVAALGREEVRCWGCNYVSSDVFWLCAYVPVSACVHAAWGVRACA